MPAIEPPATILVTGASGFSAIWIVHALLESGYTVRGTVRSLPKAEYLLNTFKEYGARFHPMIVADASKPGAFDECIQDDVSGVIHVAGVARFDSNLDEIMGPNHQAVVNLLNSLLSKGQSAKRFIYMSSAQAMLGKPLTHVYTEDDWNDTAVAVVKEKRQAADGQTIYAASKVFAERSIMDFVIEHRGEIGWDAVRFVPAFIYGPILHQCHKAEDLNLSSALMRKYLTTTPEKGCEGAYCSEYIDVRDVAAAFVAALKIEEAGGERFILDAGAFTYQNLYDAVHSISPDLPEVPRGDTEAPKFSFPGAFCDSSKAKRILKLQDFRSLANCARDTLESLRERGF